MEAYLWLAIFPDGEEANDGTTDDAQENEDANDEIVPFRALHGLVAEPWFLVFSNEPVALENALGAAHS
jgi:hypothetical protein